VSYYYTNQADRAITQFDYSLGIDPKHLKTLLNMGVVRAFGKQDLEGASAVWKQVIALAPESPEGQAARKSLDAIVAGHANLPSGSQGQSGTPQ
jgi:tetratricopeptide (TPR) repeat protein